MNNFQAYPADMLEMNPFTTIGKDWMLITAGDKEKANTMTATASGRLTISFGWVLMIPTETT